MFQTRKFLIISQNFSVFDSITSQKQDSISYKMILANPNVYYKIKIVKFNKITNHNWEKYWMSLKIKMESRRSKINTTPEKFTLEVDPVELKNSSTEIDQNFGVEIDKYYQTSCKNKVRLKLFILKEGK